jgi:hypothetical protein
MGTAGTGLGQGLAVEGVGKDRRDAAIGVGTKMQCPGTRGIDATRAIAIGEADDAECRAEALFGMGP